MIAFNLYGHRIVAERDSLNTYKKKAEKGEAKLQVINQTSPPPLPPRPPSPLFRQPEGANGGLRILRVHLSKTLKILMN